MSESTWLPEIRRWMRDSGSDDQITAEIQGRMGGDWTPAYGEAIRRLIAAERQRRTIAEQRASARRSASRSAAPVWRPQVDRRLRAGWQLDEILDDLGGLGLRERRAVERYVREQRGESEPTGERASNPEWIATARAYRAVRKEAGGERPSQPAVAKERHLSERTLATKLRGMGIPSWHAVHALIEAED